MADTIQNDPNAEAAKREQFEKEQRQREADRVAAEQRSQEATKRNVDPAAEGRTDERRDPAAKADADKAREDAAKARVAADEAQAKADEAGLTDEQRAARKAAQEADDAAARAAHAEGEENRIDEDTTVAEAGVNAPHVDPDTPAGHYLAVKRSNDPSNPKPAKPEHSDPKLATVKMEMFRLDAYGGKGGTVYKWVHPEMVGDEARSGWGRSTS